MKNSNAETLAQAIVNTKKAEQVLADQMSELKAELIGITGEGGEVYQAEGGKVTVTKKTLDRSAGTFVYSLDPAAFTMLDESIQANLIKQGVIRREEKMIRGQDPVVKVSLT